MYGGTKTEMQRLLADAQELTGVKYDIKNLSDVYNAIHVIQKNMKVTGTTAKEASETITGSMTAAKAAWQNFLSGTVDIKTLVKTVITAAKNIGKELIKIVPDVATGLISLINGLIPYIPNLIKQLIPVFVKGIIDLTMGLLTMLPEIINILLQGLITIVSALADALPDLLPAIVDAVVDIIPVLIDNLPLFIEAGIKLIVGLALGIVQATPRLLALIPKLVKSIVKYFLNLPNMLFNIAKNTLMQFGNVFVKNANAVYNNVKNFSKKVVSTIKTILTPGALKNIGHNLISGLWNGIKAKFDSVVEGVKGLAAKLPKAVKKVLGIASPSKVMFQIGKYTVEGLRKGMTTEDFKKIGTKMGKNFISGMKSQLSKAESLYKELKSNLSSVDLFSNGQLTDLSVIKQEINAYGKNLTKIKSKIPKGLYQQILGMDREEGLAYTNELLNMSSQNLKSYVSDWKAIQKSSASISKKYYNSEVKSIKEKYTKELKTQFSSLKSLMGGLGKNAVNGLINGMKSQTKGLTGVSKTLANQIIKTVKKQLKIKSPSKVMSDLGKYTTEGYIKGIESLKDKLDEQMVATFSLSPNVTNSASTNFSPSVNVINNIEMKQDPLGQMVNQIKTFSGGAKNDYNYGKA